MGFCRVHRRLDTRRHGVDANPGLRILDCERSRCCAQRSFCERGQRGRDAAHWLVDKACCNRDDVAASLLAHKFQRTLSHVKEARHIRRHVERIVIGRINREWFCHEHAGVVNQRVDATETLECRFEHSLGRVRSTDIALYGHDARIGDRLDRPRCCNNPVVMVPESLKNTRTDPLRRSRYYGYFLLCAHDSPCSKSKLRLISASPLVISGSYPGCFRIPWSCRRRTPMLPPPNRGSASASCSRRPNGRA